MHIALKTYNQYRRNMGYLPISIGVGIHSGQVIIGTIGTENRMESTVLGDAVNVASRLEGLTRYYNAKIIISANTYRLLEKDHSFLCREIDFVKVKGKEVPLSIFEVYNSDPQEIRDLKQEILPLYKEGLELGSLSINT